jgi:hypothetical protein
MQAPFLTDFQRLISPPRFHAFRDGGGDQDAVARYLWNTALSEALYPAFQMLEVGYRNAVHVEIGREAAIADWLLAQPSFLRQRELVAIDQARVGLIKERKTVAEPRMVAQLNFGFWTCLLDSPYDQLWHRIIHRVVPHMPRRGRTRQALSARMHAIRKLRNLAFHHHAIWNHPRLKSVHAEAVEMLRWPGLSLEPAVRLLDRFPDLLNKGWTPYSQPAGNLIAAP